MEHGQSHLAVAPAVTLAAVARVAGGGVSHAASVATGSTGTQRVHARLSLGGLSGDVAWRAPAQQKRSQRVKTSDICKSCRDERLDRGCGACADSARRSPSTIRYAL